MKKHTATHQGFTFTRNSASRAYTHVVVVAHSRSAERVARDRSARSDWSNNLSFYQRAAASEPGYFSAREIEYAKQRQALGEEGYVAEALASFDARTASMTLAADGDTYYTEAGWCGRPDLAAKLAASSGGVAVAATMHDNKAVRA